MRIPQEIQKEIELKVKAFSNGRDDTYATELMEFGGELKAKFGSEPEFVAYSGGVLGTNAYLKIEDYDAVKVWLTEKFGEPKQMKSWYSQHTKTCPPLRFTKRASMENQKMDHVNLISMMQQKKKQYIIVSWM